MAAALEERTLHRRRAAALRTCVCCAPSIARACCAPSNVRVSHRRHAVSTGSARSARRGTGKSCARVACRYADGESKTTGAIYMAGDAHRDLLNDAYCMFSQANPLHVDLFPSVRRMEAEVLSMTAALLGGGRSGVATVRPSLHRRQRRQLQHSRTPGGG